MHPLLDLLNEKLHGKYTLNGDSCSGENITLWLGGSLGENAFYLEFGFYGDDGGKTNVYEGAYARQGDLIILRTDKETERKWDDSIDYEDLTEKPSAVEMEGKIIFHEKNLSIELSCNNNLYPLKKREA